jgi:uncharacterized protein (TIGR01777 family)
MKIVIAGATGFLGRPLTAALLADGHDVVALSRSGRAGVPGTRTVAWDPQRPAAPWAAELDDADGVVNLAGEPIADHRWTAARKHRIEDSRVTATRRIAEAIAQSRRPAAVLVSGSGVGFYGRCGDEIVTEQTGAGSDFLAAVCRRWEAQAVTASSSATRVACIRTGLVLAHDGGALAKMLLPFRLGLGGRLGSGRQYWPWIHRQDWVNLVRFVLHTPGAVGPINATAPTPVTNAEFTKAIGRTLGRPTIAAVPAFALRIALGEMADSLLLAGQRAVPARATELGFTFGYRSLDSALDAVLHDAK